MFHRDSNKFVTSEKDFTGLNPKRRVGMKAVLIWQDSKKLKMR